MARRVRGGSIGEMGPFLGDSVGFVIDDLLGLLRDLRSSMASKVVLVRWLQCLGGDDGRRGDMASFLGESLGLVIDVLGLLRRNLLFSSITGKESMQGMRVWLLLHQLLRVRRPTTLGPNSNEMEAEPIEELSEASEVDNDSLAPTPFVEIWFMLTGDFFDSAIILTFS